VAVVVEVVVAHEPQNVFDPIHQEQAKHFFVEEVVQAAPVISLDESCGQDDSKEQEHLSAWVVQRARRARRTGRTGRTGMAAM